ncbi:putative transporter (transmembrane protein) [Antricoccus suffuscus]|uniref:Putative transporter (Transmembrane protein) n=1 Tax=Antricoccus suffuscus TaxID=1629062 RepID=A0A2T1A504_9ACTN|nr:hypothetical protein [Antricoccus suffuscus]PRZ43685.1 putative transporter (transmembrane protein) [Antricoccus suffuscus]
MSAGISTSQLALDWSSGLTSAWASIASFVPKLVIFLIVMLIGWLIAKAVSKLVRMVLDKVGFARLLDRSGISKFFQNSNFTAITLIEKLVYYFILLITLQLALSAFGPTNPVSAIVNDIVAWLPKAIVAIIIVVIAAAVARVVRDLLSGSLSALSYGATLAKIASWFIIALGVIAALNQIGIGLAVTTPVLVVVLATIAGVIIVGVGGGLIGPMRQRWDGWLDQMSADTKAAKEHNQTRTANRQGQGQYPVAGQGQRPAAQGQPQNYPAQEQFQSPQGAQQFAPPPGASPQQGYPDDRPTQQFDAGNRPPQP